MVRRPSSRPGPNSLKRHSTDGGPRYDRGSRVHPRSRDAFRFGPQAVIAATVSGGIVHWNSAPEDHGEPVTIRLMKPFLATPRRIGGDGEAADDPRQSVRPSRRQRRLAGSFHVAPSTVFSRLKKWQKPSGARHA